MKIKTVKFLRAVTVPGRSPNDRIVEGFDTTITLQEHLVCIETPDDVLYVPLSLVLSLEADKMAAPAAPKKGKAAK